jgi:nucleotide-binding universal stress UspA family protein
MSKKIIVGIDFSNCSINALEHAITIANKAKSNITMVWVNHLDYSKEIFSIEPKQLLGEVEERLNNLVETYSPQLKGLNIDFIIKKGKVYKEICDYGAAVNAFLIIVGTHGSSGFEEFWIGSNANRIVSTSKIPTITIRSGVDVGRDLMRIVVPFDSTKVTRQKMPITALLANYFNSEVHLLGLFTSSLDDIRFRIRNYISQAEEYLKENNIKYKTTFIEVHNITEATLNYAKNVDANLISIMTEQETSTANIWLGPYAAQMVNHSPIPVLSVHPDKLKFYNG